MTLRVTLKISQDIRDIEDGFSREIVELWDTRNLLGKCYALCDKGIPVSYILVEEHGEINTIRGFYTVPEYRGKGIGSTLLKFVCEAYEGLGATTMIVNIGTGAEHVYERNGFTLLGKRKDFPDQIVAYRGVLDEKQAEILDKKIR